MNLADHILQLPKKVTSGCMSIYGCYLGRPLDTYEEFDGAFMDGNVLVLKYDRVIRVEIWVPSALEVSGNYMTIPSAARVRQSWDTPGEDGTMYFHDYVMKDQKLHYSTNMQYPKQPSLASPAFQIG